MSPFHLRTPWFCMKLLDSWEGCCTVHDRQLWSSIILLFNRKKSLIVWGYRCFVIWCHAHSQCYCVQNTLRRIKSPSPCCVTLLSLSLCLALALPLERLQAQWQLLCCQVPTLHIWRAFQESPVSQETMWFCCRMFACTRKGTVCVTISVIILIRCLGLRGVVSGSVKPWRDGCPVRGSSGKQGIFQTSWTKWRVSIGSTGTTTPNQKSQSLKKRKKKPSSFNVKTMFVYLVFYMYTSGVSVALMSFFQNNVVLFYLYCLQKYRNPFNIN